MAWHATRHVAVTLAQVIHQLFVAQLERPARCVSNLSYRCGHQPTTFGVSPVHGLGHSVGVTARRKNLDRGRERQLTAILRMKLRAIQRAGGEALGYVDFQQIVEDLQIQYRQIVSGMKVS
jgi:hypothetical protein